MEPSSASAKWVERKGEFLSYTRFAIYYLPPEGSLADFGAAWLGWDCVAGRDLVQPDVPGLDDVTARPRKYGFHGTLKPPFRLAEGREVTGLHTALQAMAGQLSRVRLAGLELAQLGDFLALVPVGETRAVEA